MAPVEGRRRKMTTRSMKGKAQKDKPPTGNKPHSPPTKSSNKVKSNKPKRGKAGIEDAPIGENTKGLPVLPDELLLEIMSWYPVPQADIVSAETSDYRALAQNASEHAARRDTLVALSQTCSRLKRFFRPYIWSRIEVCSGMHVGDAMFGVQRYPAKYLPTSTTNRMINAELVRQLEIVTVRDPSLAEYVKILNAEVEDYSTPTVLTELARCIALFPNLHLVRLEILSSTRTLDNLTTLVSKSFAPYSYPQIDHVVVDSESALSFLRSCPSVRSVNLMNLKLSGEFGKHLKGICPQLENLTIDMAALYTEETLQVFLNLPTLTLVFNHFNHSLFLSKFMLLGALKNLKTIKLVTDQSYSIRDTHKQRALDFAVQHLLKLQAEDKEEKEASLTYMPTVGLGFRYSANRNHMTERIRLPVPKPG
ncbi:hypothetical protein GALMADRAFT_136434 [Galerina marginata CBS 339.88]|uniref:F-box domain-containing protein n=1 Tax=Galerina marginata (strain CBS 339.88) TaxID=685588 RepID=A0A067TBW3_GALM3|nr:hypothetical protein GALMADRAFT_136434 [Galerina marginata CBS 339.88]